MIVFPFVCSCMGPHYIVHKWYNVTLYSYILEGQLHEEIQCPLHLPFYVLVIWGTKLLCRFCSDFIACKIFIHCQYKWTSTYKCENLSKFPSQVELKQILDSYVYLLGYNKYLNARKYSDTYIVNDLYLNFCIFCN